MTDKKKIIQILEEMAVLFDLKGENPFKVRAYSNAARILQGMGDEFTQLVQTNQLVQIKGIGKSIAEVITEIWETGKSAELEQMKSEIPETLLDMLKIPGMGPKKVKAVWEKLNITTIGELEYACKENRLVDLEGFGQKTQEKILQGIELVKKYSERHLLSDAREAAVALFDQIKEFKGIIRCEIAGSLRRWKETIKDIDILASAAEEDRESIMAAFTSLPEVETVTARGKTKSSVVLKRGINADLRLVSDQQFPYALHHFTGSKEHNVAMRQFAQKLNLKMNEYGLFTAEMKNIPCQSEADIFQHLGMAYIPPELRENLGEIEAALRKELPELLTFSDLKGMIHVHSRYSDGENSILELAQACQQRGFTYLVVSDHSKSAMYANGLTEERIIAQQQEIDQLNQNLNNFRILKSIEADILPDGSLDYPDSVLATFDLVIASIHSRFNMSEQEATTRLIQAMENPYVTILGHPTGRLLLGREGYPVNMPEVIDAAAKLGVALELNANPHRLDVDWRLLRTAREKGVKISINPDAHRIDGLDDIHYGVGIARKGWLTKEDVLNFLDVDQLLAFAARRKSR
ncbi:MAG: DNA polymerase/3'-5' exonuclease PolX [Calditrichia bacterium]